MSERLRVIEAAVQSGYNEDDLKRLPSYEIEKLLADRKPVQKDENQPVLPASSLDDTETVVDMSHMKNTTNPAEQKYCRFKFLVKARNTINDAVRINTGLKNSNQDQLDPEDILIFEKEIANQQSNLKLINIEMHEIFVWYQQVEQQRKSFLSQLTQRMVDLNGNLTRHFKKKLENISTYMENIQHEFQTVNR